ncbi:MAG: hypothetical protein SXQ77_00540 [Halobacteria archaeon]|nr:hypothetical protein [Halobacteria archaeon]
MSDTAGGADSGGADTGETVSHEEFNEMKEFVEEHLRESVNRDGDRCGGIRGTRPSTGTTTYSALPNLPRKSPARRMLTWT